MKKITILLMIFSFQGISQIDTNLLLYYKFDGNTLDETENHFNGNANGINYTIDRFGNENSAVRFDGLNDYIDFPNVSELKPQLPVSFSFWIKYDSTVYTDTEVFNTSFQEDESSGIYFNTQASTGNYAINYGDGSPFYNPTTRRTYISNQIIDTDQWHQIVVVVKSALNMEIYIDCQENGGTYSGSGGNLFYSFGAGSIGRNDRDLGVPANYFKGSLDDFRYWDKALDNEEIQTLCNTLEIDNIEPKTNFSIFPNPAKERVFIKSNKENPFNIVLYDNLGKSIKLEYFNSEINTSSLSNGIYFVKLTSEDNVIVKKLIINK